MLEDCTLLIEIHNNVKYEHKTLQLSVPFSNTYHLFTLRHYLYSKEYSYHLCIYLYNSIYLLSKIPNNAVEIYQPIRDET